MLMEIIKKFWSKTEKRETIKNSISNKEKREEIVKNEPNLITTKEVQELLGVSAPTVRKYANLGYYNAYKYGKKLVFYRKEEILSFVLNSSNKIKDGE